METQSPDDATSSKSKSEDTQSSKPGPTAAAVGSANKTTSADTTPCGDKGKRKCTSTPSSAEPDKKRPYAHVAGSGEETAPKKKAQVLWVHSNLTEKSYVTEAYFFEVISRCNKFRVDGALKGDPELAIFPATKPGPRRSMRSKRSVTPAWYPRTHAMALVLKIWLTPPSAWMA